MSETPSAARAHGSFTLDAQQVANLQQRLRLLEHLGDTWAATLAAELPQVDIPPDKTLLELQEEVALRAGWRMLWLTR